MSPFLDENGDAHLIYSADLFPALHNTIVITFNYRQDLFATLYVENKSMRGNLGLFDQNLAIQFAKKYIKDFCGDEDNLTLFGNSYGSMAVGLHLISKYSKNLFKNAIMQSASPLFHDNTPTTANEEMINSLLAINDLGCANLNNSNLINVHIKKLNQMIKSKFFQFIDGQYFLKEKFFLTELNKYFYRFESKMNAGLDNLNKDDYIARDVLKLTRFLSKHIVDTECLQNLAKEKVIEVDERYLHIFFKDYYDFDFVDTEAYLNYKLFNRLNLNPNVNILAGGVSNEKGSVGLFLKDKYYTDQFNAPLIPKEDVKELIKQLGYLKTNKKEFADYMANFYTNESRWELSRGYYDSYTNTIADYEFYCPLHFYLNYAALTANSVSSYQINYLETKHLASSNFVFDLDNYSWCTSLHSDVSSFLKKLKNLKFILLIKYHLILGVELFMGITV